jgi:hypothetical protein
VSKLVHMTDAIKRRIGRGGRTFAEDMDDLDRLTRIVSLRNERLEQRMAEDERRGLVVAVKEGA